MKLLNVLVCSFRSLISFTRCEQEETDDIFSARVRALDLVPPKRGVVGEGENEDTVVGEGRSSTVPIPEKL